MKKAIILYGPSGAGKSTLAKSISRLGYIHCDADTFKRMYSPKRSAERTKIGEKLCVTFAREIIPRKHNIIIETLPDPHMKRIKRLLKRHHYAITEISLTASLGHCIANDKKRAVPYGRKVIREVHPKFSSEKGIVIAVDGKTPRQVFRMVKKHL